MISMQQPQMEEREPAAEAAVAVLHARLPVESILLIRRAENPSDPWSGHWSFPGGRREASDGDLVDTALRELREECSILLNRNALSRSLPYSVAGRRVGRFVSVAPFVFHLEEQVEATLDTTEASDYLWTPVETIADRSLHRWQTVPGVPDGRLFPAVDLKGIPLWGFTYRVLCECLGVEIPAES
jgi:8-oxo-dGTP pyrophosphatase MutT (NUDIX family)